MKSTSSFGTLAVVIGLCVMTVTAYSQPGKYFGGGDGTKESPYIISAPGHLIELEGKAIFGDFYRSQYAVMADIDMAGTAVTIGGGYHPFEGTFEGNGHAIRNLAGHGLFGLHASGIVRNLRVLDAHMSIGDWSNGVAILAHGSSGTIENCHVTGTVTAGNHCVSIGGLVASLDGTVSHCTISCTITTGDNCDKIGGLAGESYGTVFDCSFVGSISAGAENSNIGGFAGYSYGSLRTCFSRGSILAGNDASNIGGFVGHQHNASISDCYSQVEIHTGLRTHSVGGFVGQQALDAYSNPPSQNIRKCYSAGLIETGADSQFIGGLIGFGNGAINSYWDQQASGQTLSGGGLGRTTAQMRTGSTYVFWNTPGETPDWTLLEGDYPRLAWEGASGSPLSADTIGTWIPGAGTAEDPYRIGTAEQMCIMGVFYSLWDKVFILDNDIDWPAEMELPRIGIYGRPFTGSFDGRGHAIRNLTVSAGYESCLGLFGCSEGSISNLSLEDADIRSFGNRVGGVAGYLRGSANGCRISGSVQGLASDSTEIGGIAGRLEGNGIISESSSAGTVRGGTVIGGIVGRDDGTIHASFCRTILVGDSIVGGMAGFLNDHRRIENSYFNGLITAKQYKGGAVGTTALGYLTNCYSVCPDTPFLNTGWFPSVQNCFHDARGGGQADKGMLKGTTYVNAGWDFENTWAICEGTNYPRLKWQIPATDWICPDGVAIEDILYLAERWMARTPEMVGAADANGDGKVDFVDFGILGENWMKGM